MLPIITILADPVLPTSKLGNGIAGVWAQYGMIAIVCGLVALLVYKTFNMLMKHPVIFAILLIATLFAIGAIRVGVK